MRWVASNTPAITARISCGGCRVIRVLCGRYFGGGIVSVGYAIAHPRLNPVGILPPGSRPSDVHSDDGFIMVMDAMTCEACEAETQARHIARGKRSATPGYRHHPPTRHPHRMRITYLPRRDSAPVGVYRCPHQTHICTPGRVRIVHFWHNACLWHKNIL